MILTRYCLTHFFVVVSGKMPKKKKSEWYAISALCFAVLVPFMVALLFPAGEGRTYGQLVAAAVAGIVGNTEWWKYKHMTVHATVIIGLIVSALYCIFLFPFTISVQLQRHNRNIFGAK